MIKKSRGFVFILFATLAAFILTSCGGSSTAIVKDSTKESLGKEYRVLKFPVNKHFIGAEWMLKKNEANEGKGFFDDDMIVSDRSLNQLSDETARKFAIGLSASVGYAGASAGIVNELTKGSNLSNIYITKPRPNRIADIAFLDGIAYVTEAIKIDNFVFDKQSGTLVFVEGKVGLGAVVPIGGGGAVDGGSVTRSVASGESLYLGYKLERLKKGSRKIIEDNPQILPVNDNAWHKLPNTNLSATASLMTINEGASLPSDLIWACDEAKSQRKSIKAAWVFKVKNDELRKGVEKKIAFPAIPTIEKCSAYDGRLFSGIDSSTEEIQRIMVKIIVSDSLIDAVGNVAQFKGEISTQKESFLTEIVSE